MLGAAIASSMFFVADDAKEKFIEVMAPILEAKSRWGSAGLRNRFQQRRCYRDNLRTLPMTRCILEASEAATA